MTRWPKQQRLVQDIRAVLRGDFGCKDAWVVASHSRYRLEIRVAGRQITLLADDEEPFWSRFYTPVRSVEIHLGERVTQPRLWRKSRNELRDVLSDPWMTRVGPLPVRRASSPDVPRLPRA